MGTVIIGSTEFELSLLIQKLGCRTKTLLQGFVVHHTNQRGRQVAVVRSGPGIANAAAATALAIERFHPDHVYNVGVCGVYSDDASLLAKAVVGKTAVFADTGVDGGKAFLPMQEIDLPLTKLEDGHTVYNRITLHDKAASRKLRRGAFLTVSAVSGTPEKAARIRRRFILAGTGLVCEDMESAAVGLMALKSSLACSVVRGISNRCGERDYARWKLSDAAAAAQKEILKLVSCRDG